MKVPSTVEIKHQLLVLWLKDQAAKEATEAAAAHAELSTAPRGRDATR
jgi:hypothetical protein